MNKPQNHYFEVEMSLSNINQKSLVIKLPIWATGSYLVSEFSKNINSFSYFFRAGFGYEFIKRIAISVNTGFDYHWNYAVSAFPTYGTMRINITEN